MNRLTRAITVACLAGIAALVPAAGAVASTLDTTSKAAVAQEGLIPDNAARKNCGSNYNNCVTVRSEFRRYYNVSDFTYIPSDVTCPGGCAGDTYYFHYWKK